MGHIHYLHVELEASVVCTSSGSSTYSMKWKRLPSWQGHALLVFLEAVPPLAATAVYAPLVMPPLLFILQLNSESTAGPPDLLQSSLDSLTANLSNGNSPTVHWHETDWLQKARYVAL